MGVGWFHPFLIIACHYQRVLNKFLLVVDDTKLPIACSSLKILRSFKIPANLINNHVHTHFFPIHLSSSRLAFQDNFFFRKMRAHKKRGESAHNMKKRQYAPHKKKYNSCLLSYEPKIIMIKLFKSVFSSVLLTFPYIRLVERVKNKSNLHCFKMLKLCGFFLSHYISLKADWQNTQTDFLLLLSLRLFNSLSCTNNNLYVCIWITAKRPEIAICAMIQKQNGEERKKNC